LSAQIRFSGAGAGNGDVCMLCQLRSRVNKYIDAFFLAQAID
jgi:hypothetical protein